MKSICISAFALGIAGVLTLGHAAPAAAQDINLSIGAPGFAFSFNTGDVAFAYVDGYWDHDHNWHRWHDEREREAFRARYAERYDARFHERVENQGWREVKREEHEEKMDRHEERKEERREERDERHEHHHDDD